MIPLILIGAAYLIGKTMEGESYSNGGKLPLLAPNGKPSNLNPEQWHLVRTTKFKEWFGDWEKGIFTDFQKFVEFKHKTGTARMEMTSLEYIVNENDIQKAKEVQEIQKTNAEYIEKVYKEAIDNGYDINFNDFIVDINKRYKIAFDIIKTFESNDYLNVFNETLKFFNPNVFEEWTIHKNIGISKVVDINGEPLVVYHGTKEKFNQFDYKYFGRTDGGFFGKGFYFTPSIESAKVYASISDWDVLNNTFDENGFVLKCFLNLKNPIYVETKIDFINASGKREIRDGYDGKIIVPNSRYSSNTEYIAFYPNQIKLADGSNTTFDSSNPDIRYAVGGGVDKVEKNLVALHNINENQILLADTLGGLVTPSIAILKAGERFTDFADITLIANKELIDPKKSSVRVFAGDVYSPTVPRKLYHVDNKKYSNISNQLISKSYRYDREIYNLCSRYLDSSEFSQDLNRREFNYLFNDYYERFKLIYIIDNEIQIKAPMKEKKHYLYNNFEFTLTKEQKKRFAIVLKKYNKESDEKGSYNVDKETKSEVYDLFLEVLNGYKKSISEKYKDKPEVTEFLFDNYEKNFEKMVGTRYDWGGWCEYNLSKAVYGEQEIDKEKFNKVINNIFTKEVKEKYEKWLSKFINQFRGSAYFLKGNTKVEYNIDNLVDATSNAVVGQEKNLTFGINKAKSYALKEFKSIDEIKKKSNTLISKDEMSIIDKENSDRFHELAEKMNYKYDDSWDKFDSLGKSIADYYKGFSAASALSRNDFKSPTQYQVFLFKDYADKVKNSPVDYFEAKIGRAVALNEFLYAVVPYKTNKKVIDILKNNGVKVKKYKTDDERIEITNSIVNKDKKIKFEQGGNAEFSYNTELIK